MISNIRVNISRPTFALVFTSALLSTMAPHAASAYTDLTDHYKGLVAFGGDGTKLGRLYNASDFEVYNLYSRKANDTLGDRLQVQGRVADMLPANGDAVYAKVKAFRQGTYCFTSGIGGGDSFAISVSCTDGWTNDTAYDAERFVPAGSAAWYSYVFRYYNDEVATSQMYALRVCEQEWGFLPDICSGPRNLGISWKLP